MVSSVMLSCVLSMFILHILAYGSGSISLPPNITSYISSSRAHNQLVLDVIRILSLLVVFLIIFPHRLDNLPDHYVICVFGN